MNEARHGTARAPLTHTLTHMRGSDRHRHTRPASQTKKPAGSQSRGGKPAAAKQGRSPRGTVKTAQDEAGQSLSCKADPACAVCCHKGQAVKRKVKTTAVRWLVIARSVGPLSQSGRRGQPGVVAAAAAAAAPPGYVGPCMPSRPHRADSSVGRESDALQSGSTPLCCRPRPHYPRTIMPACL